MNTASDKKLQRGLLRHLRGARTQECHGLKLGINCWFVQHTDKTGISLPNRFVSTFIEGVDKRVGIWRRAD